MGILVFNCGSSSLTYKVYRLLKNGELKETHSGKAHRVGVRGSEAAFIEHHTDGDFQQCFASLPDHPTASRLILQYLQGLNLPLEAIGHRFVHGGEKFKRSVWLTGETIQDIEECLRLAPIHNPNSMSAIRVCAEVLPEVPQYLTFDTAFHGNLPDWAALYPLPQDLGFRKFGFHGLSYQYVCGQCAEYLGKPLGALRLIACHLGTGGSSVVAVENGKTVDTSMGYTPLQGLMMSTRSGDLDVMIPPFLTTLGYTARQINEMLNKQSGLLGVAGFSSDLRDILSKRDTEPRAEDAYNLYSLRLAKVIASYLTLMQGCDALIFTDDVGVSVSELREQVCGQLSWAGVHLNEDQNNRYKGGIQSIHTEDSTIQILIIPTNEELVIATEYLRLKEEDAYAHP